MEMVHRMLITLLAVWGTFTVILILLLIHRSILATREEDQIFLDPAERALENEQRAVVARIQKLARSITALFILSGASLVASVGMWLWQGLHNF